MSRVIPPDLQAADSPSPETPGRRPGPFRVARPLLTALAAALRLVPRPLCGLALAAIRHLPTTAGVALRYVLVRRLARKCGDRVVIAEGVYLFRLENAEFGDNISINPMCYLDAYGGLSIGSDVSIAHGCTIMTSEHNYAVPGNTRDAALLAGPVAIDSDVWLGCAVRVLSGVRIGSHSVVGAGAVVTRDVPPNSLALGVPARPVKRIKQPPQPRRDAA